MIRSLPPIALALLIAAAASQAPAAEAYQARRVFSPSRQIEVLQVKVPSADLDLATAQGAATLVDRLRLASDAACGGAANVRGFVERLGYEDCQATAMSEAVRQLRNPLVSAIASGHGAATAADAR